MNYNTPTGEDRPGNQSPEARQSRHGRRRADPASPGDTTPPSEEPARSDDATEPTRTGDATEPIQTGDATSPSAATEPIQTGDATSPSAATEPIRTNDAPPPSEETGHPGASAAGAATHPGSAHRPGTRHGPIALIPRAVGAVLAAVLSVAAVVVLERAAVDTASGQRLDQLVLDAARGDESIMAQVVAPALSAVTVPVIIVILAVAALFCIVRRRLGLLAQIAVMVVGANITTQLMQVLVDRQALAAAVDITPNSFPSGHTTLAASATIAVTLAMPDRLRGLTAVLATIWMPAVGVGTVAAGWHRPSDVVGAMLVVGAWTFLVLAIDAIAARAAPHRPVRRPPAHGRRGLAGPLLVTVAVIAVAAGTLVMLSVPMPLDLDDPAHQLPAYLGTTLLILGGNAALMAMVLAFRVPHIFRGPRR